MSGTKVVLEIDGKALLAAQDGVEFIKQQALQEIRLRKKYDQEEMDFVEKDPVFLSSCGNVYLKIRDAASARESRDGRVADKGKTPTHAPFRWKVAIHYERPGTRNWMGKLMKE